MCIFFTVTDDLNDFEYIDLGSLKMAPYSVLTNSSNMDKKERFQCPKCYRSYKYRKGLRGHMRYECGLEPRFECSFCGYRSKQKSNLKTHIRIRHLHDKKKFCCSYCPYESRHRHNRNLHVANKHGLKTYGNAEMPTVID